MNDGCSRKKRKRLRGGGQEAAHYDVESSLSDWVISQRENMHLRVTRQSIALQEKQMIQDPDFKASRGWIDRFMRD